MKGKTRAAGMVVSALGLSAVLLSAGACAQGTVFIGVSAPGPWMGYPPGMMPPPGFVGRPGWYYSPEPQPVAEEDGDKAAPAEEVDSGERLDVEIPTSGGLTQVSRGIPLTTRSPGPRGP